METLMTRIDPDLVDAMQPIHEADAPSDAWSLDELDQNSDLESVHWASARNE